ncbi:hypothetical protein IKP85_02750 [bacterium]|nr:hypothetical protein [bacterium]
MRKIIIAVLLMLLFQTAGTYTAAWEIDDKPAKNEKSDCKWVNLHQTERDAKIRYMRGKLTAFGENKSIKKSEFKKQYRRYMKDAKTDANYRLISDGVKVTNENIMTGYFKEYNDAKVLYEYSLQPRRDYRNVFYYNGEGNLIYMNSIAGPYPRFPYISRQYNNNGRLKNIIYFENHDLQYVYKANGKFRGLWDGDTMYNRRGYIIKTRTNW